MLQFDRICDKTRRLKWSGCIWRHSFSPEGEAHRVEPGYRPAARNGAGTLKTSPSAPQPDSTSVIAIVRDFCRSHVHVIRLI